MSIMRPLTTFYFYNVDIDQSSFICDLYMSLYIIYEMKQACHVMSSFVCSSFLRLLNGEKTNYNEIIGKEGRNCNDMMNESCAN